ncbi:MAG TPA: XRE family transcriptional regulator [Polaromonas sp.]|uniref:XRE family transcriptional regulator n=1 Tax=Polaromonas sp. TaxID=1869339 RepID=UPI002D60C7E2|nr:XRE family transcriptional regulator [Polaromonas sp.]HYW57698.1 XRE family transcriptional regulator [Polaromonas sp.]
MQLTLPMLTYYEGPRLISQEVLAAVLTYREAVLVCWDLRTRRSLTHRQLAVEAHLYASHVSDYLNKDSSKRELPAKHVANFEVACGNRAISQWLAKQANLTILEQFIERKAA